ncbi:MAG: HEAT repeat domain-containing protein [Anaerolineales bacterium]|nr:HEAT repeat domain-containing protein [Anaerolineales bacterium]NUQ84219.1 HEAT repeat domain-containing protein [Anaerolineales bacterium]
MEAKGNAQLASASQRSFNTWVERWTLDIQSAQKQVNNKSLPAWISIILGAVFLCAGIGIFTDYTWAGMAIFAVGIAAGILLFNQATRFRKGEVQRIAGEIQQTCQNEGLAKEEVVESLYGKTKGKVSQEVLQAVDPDTAALLKLRERGQEFFKNASSRKIQPMQISVNATSGSVTSVTVQGEQDVDRFSGMAVEYLAHKGYVEGISALAMVQMLYTEIAPPAGELFISTSQFNPALREVSINAHKIMSSFDFKPEMKTVKETVTRRRTQSFLELLLSAQEQQTGLDNATLAAALEKASLRVRDEAFVGDCIDYIGRQTSDLFKRNKAYELLALIPDIRTLPYLLDAFKQLLFFPQGVEAMAFLGEETHAKLIEAMRTGSGFLRFNAALTLGFMNVEAAKPELEETLPGITDPTEKAGVCYALVRLGEPKHLKTIVEILDNPNEDVRHVAAIALEHLTEPLEDSVYLKHLNDANMLVRLRLTRKLGVQKTESPKVINVLIERFDDNNEDVRAAAVASLGGLNPELIYSRMVELSEKGTTNTRLCAYEVLGKISQAEAIPLLTDALSKKRDNDSRRTVLSALGELGAVEATDQIARYLDNDDLSNAAFWALLRISLKDKETGTKPLAKQGKHRIKRLFLLALHGEQQAKTELKGMLGAATDFMTLIQALEYVQILRAPEFEAPLRQLLTYRQPNRFPGDRYVSYMALKALVHIVLAKA